MNGQLSAPLALPSLAGATWWHSLKTRVALLTLTIFVLSMLSLAYFASRSLREDMQRVLGIQQSSTVSLVAAEVNQELADRLTVLEKVAARITPAMLANSAALQLFLEERLILQGPFNAGTFATRLDGTAIADIPVSAGRIGINYMDRDSMISALRGGKATIGRPALGKKVPAPVFVMAMPIRDVHGKVIGALVGVTNLSLPNFLDKLIENPYGRTGGYLVVAPQHGLFVTATDKTRIMQPLPAQGINPLHDRYMQGYEGYGVATSSRGVEELSAAKGIPAAGWFLVSVMPSDEAFAPIGAMQQHMLLATIVLTLVAGSLTWWMLRRQLSPLLAATQTLATRSATSEPLPVTSQDEIGELIGGFNRLLETLQHREGTLKESEARFRNLFEKNSSVMLLIEPSSGQIVDANTAAASFYGYPRARLTGMCINEINTQAPEIIAAERLMALREERNYFLFPHRLASGEVREVEVHTTPIETDGRPLLLSIVHDITERVRLEETLKESELRYRTVADFTSDWEYWVLADGTLRYMSPSCEQISGYTLDEFYADPHLLTRIIQVDDQPLYAGHSHHLSAQGIPEPIDFRIRTRAGETLWISHVCRPVVGPAGQSLGLRASNRDITARKRAEAALQRTNADLRRFAEITAHHLQEPARRLVNYTERLTQQLADRSVDAEVLLSLEFIGQQARREQALLHDVERYLAADQPRGKVGPVDVNQTVAAILPRLEAETSGVGVTFRLGNLPPCRIDLPRLNDLFEVVLDNALHHGRGEHPLRITIEGERQGGSVRYSISDNGPGIEAQYRERVFRVFEKLSAGSAVAGTGIGLAILRRIAESCDGHAWIEAAQGGGCRVAFELPAGEIGEMV